MAIHALREEEKREGNDLAGEEIDGLVEKREFHSLLSPPSFFLLLLFSLLPPPLSFFSLEIPIQGMIMLLFLCKERSRAVAASLLPPLLRLHFMEKKEGAAMARPGKNGVYRIIISYVYIYAWENGAGINKYGTYILCGGHISCLHR